MRTALLTARHARAGAGAELSQVVQYLRKQQDILSAELQLAQQESSRLRNEAALARRAAEAANAQLAGQAERSRASARTEEEHTALMQKLEQLNLLRESNAALRCAQLLMRRQAGTWILSERAWSSALLSFFPSHFAHAHRADNQRMLDDMARQRRRAEQAEGLAEPLRNELRQLRAAAEGQAEEIRVVCFFFFFTRHCYCRL